MLSLESRSGTLALCFSALAGYVDAVGFIKLGGFFVSSVIADVTRMGVSFAQGSTLAGIAALLIGAFVVGVMVGSVIGAKMPGQRQPAVLAMVAMLLVLAAGTAVAGWLLCTGAIMALAMGGLNAVFEEDDQLYFGSIFMTGTLVKLGEEIAQPTGRGFGWVPYLMLWLALVAGATIGALVCGVLSFGALWIAAVFAGLLAAFTASVKGHQESL
ncbi:protein of unknown function DUF1275 [Sphingobium indicum BiD32]|uniref:DUF1275 domain-containing protein n=1 Tax=Sphingobium indicum BiD32 TaxID=1301087 RepID=N1MQE4_9SPHN|nr:YoaK family protein [Sphingobium indicum]CCW17638.1 protein of unknown function DUF1275 [Sphingobium indicum BiD32]